MFYDFLYLFLLFFIYSTIGYLIEVIAVSICLKKTTFSRGYLSEPYIPIYGIGVVSVIRLLSKYQNDLLTLFIMSTIVCTILEYITSLLMEKIFKLRWWDYSDKSFNINGRVCLTNSVLFGFGGIIIMKIINPFIEKILLSFPQSLIIVLSVLFLIIFIIDFIISTITVFNIEVDIKKYTKKDATEIIKEEVREALKKHRFIIGRLFNAYPNVTQTKNINFKDYKELVLKIKEEYKKKKNKLIAKR